MLAQCIVYIIYDRCNAPTFIAGFMCTFILIFRLTRHMMFVFSKLCVTNLCDIKQQKKRNCFTTTQSDGTWLYCITCNLQLLWVLHPHMTFLQRNIYTTPKHYSHLLKWSHRKLVFKSSPSSFTRPFILDIKGRFFLMMLSFVGVRSCRGLCSNAEDAAQAWQLPAYIAQ